MRCPSAKALRAAFRDLSATDANLIRKLAHAVDEPDKLRILAGRHHGWEIDDVHRSSSVWRRTIVLRAIDRLLGTYGVEALGTVDYTAGAPYEYCNTGDTYAPTLVYERKNDRLLLASWGDIAERHDRRGDWA